MTNGCLFNSVPAESFNYADETVKMVIKLSAAKMKPNF
jgi:hypothetical protein